MFVATVILSVVVGISLGLFGGGGSILMVPILVYVLGLPAHAAVALSLLVVGTTSISALVPHARASRVRWGTGLLFGAAGMLGAFGAGRIAHYIPGSVLLLGFGVMMLVTARAMLRGPSKLEAPAAEPKRLSLPKVLGEGLAVGGVTGLVGAGGGFLVVPALVLLGGMPMELAVGTSLVVISMKSFAGFVGYLGSTPVDPAIAIPIIVAAIGGSVIGSRLAFALSPARLRAGFAWFVLAMSAFLLIQQVPETFGVHRELMLPFAVSGALLVLVAGAVAAPVRRWWWVRTRELEPSVP